MKDEPALTQLARNLDRLDRRVHVLESVARPAARARLDKVFTSEIRVAAAVWLDHADSQENLARLVSGALRRRVSQQAVSQALKKLKTAGILAQNEARAYKLEDGWREQDLEGYLRKKAVSMGINVAKRRRTRS